MDFLPDTRGLQRIMTLLLLFVFVVRTLGDCPKPLLEKNIVLSDSALLINEFLDNTEIEVECANGYFVESGSVIMKCGDGAWSDPDLTCKKVDCGPPPPQPNMKFDISEGTLFGSAARVVCDKGYKIKGAVSKYCYNAGWVGRSSCVIATCDTPPKVSDGTASWDSPNHPKYGQYIKYICDDGYTLIGKNEIMCIEDGKYDASPPQCQQTSTVLQDTTVSESATPTVLLSARGREIFTVQHSTTEMTPTKPSYQEDREDIADTKKDVGYTPVIISVVCVFVVVCIAVFFIHHLLHKRKGSYDTREDLKPELLQFQNL